MNKELHLKLTVRLYSDDDRRCFGPGIATLLERVREHRSLRAAAASMEMAYSKAWRIIRRDRCSRTRSSSVAMPGPKQRRSSSLYSRTVSFKCSSLFMLAPPSLL